MDTQSPQLGGSGSQSSRLAGAVSNTSLIGTQQESSHQLVHHYAVNADTRNMSQDEHLKMIDKTKSIKNKKQHADGCKYIHIVVNIH